MITKVCRDCKTEKLIEQYYVHKQMKDGHLNKCKDCVKTRVTKHRFENDHVREYDKLRASLPHRIVNRNRVVSEYCDNFPHRKRATQAVNTAVRDKKLFKPSICEHCKETKRLCGHHEDYSKPLEVMWLCQRCHKLHHVKINQDLNHPLYKDNI